MNLAARLQEIEPSVTLAMAARAADLRRQGVPVISLTAGEPDFDTPDHIRAAAEKAIRDGFTRYTPAGGIPELKEAVRERIHRDYGLAYGQREVTVSCGAKHAIFNALMTICDPGDEVLVFSPYWTSYPSLVRIAGGVPVVVETTREDGYLPTAAAIEAAITARTRAVILNSPNNPTGAVYPGETLEAIAGVLARTEIRIITDDIYDRLVYGGAGFASILDHGEDLRPRTVVIGSVSKTYAMTGWRIGYAAGPEAIIAGMEGLQSHTTSNPNSIAQKAALAALTGPDDEPARMHGEFDRRRRAIVAALGEIPGLGMAEPLGAFYVFPDVRSYLGRRYREAEVTGSVALAEAILDAVQVAVVPGAAFGDDGAVRLSYALALAEAEEGIARLRRFLEEVLR